MIEPQTTYGRRTEAIENARGQVSLWLSPLYLIFRPGRFMLGFGYHAPLAVVLLAAWLAGSGRMTNWVVNQQRLSADPVPWRLDSWAMLWLLLLGLGLLRGVFEYALGGLWTWLRLRICGVRGNQWGLSTRIYLFARLVEMVPLLLVLLYFSVKYPTVADYLREPVGIANYMAMAFIFLAPVIAFVEVIACYRLRRLWAAVLFLAVPLLWRVAIVGGGFVVAGLHQDRYAGPYPDTQNSIEASTDHLRFQHPNGWTVTTPSSSDEPTPIEVRIDANDEFAALVIRVQPRDEVDLIEHDLSELRNQGYSVSSGTPEPNVRIANQIGDGTDYTAQLEGNAYKMYYLLVHFDVNHDVLFRFISSERYWWHAMEGWKQILGSLSIGDLYGVEPDVANPVTVENDLFTLQAPGNWHLSQWEEPPFSGTEISAMQYSWFAVKVHDRDMSAREELEMYLGHSVDDLIVSSDEMNTWLGLHGSGAQGRFREPLAGFQQFKTLYVPLDDGRVLVLSRNQAESSKDITSPGFDLIERTFQLRQPEPTSP